MDLVAHLTPRKGVPPHVAYRWDPDTDILSVELQHARAHAAGNGSVEIEGPDGSWVLLDLTGGQIQGLEIVVWPHVDKRSALSPPANVRDAAVRFPSDDRASGVTSVEVETPLAAESDAHERIFHFRLGPPRQCTAVRVASDLLLDLDAARHVAGFWLLNVPPFPDDP